MNPITDIFFTKLLLFLVIFTLSLNVFITSQNIMASNEESNISVHFADLTKGRILWILDQNAFPWIGSYSFLKNLDYDITTLLSVVDSSTGVTLAECTYNNSLSQEIEDEKYVEFVWALSESVLQCTLSSGSKTFSLPLSQHPRSFSVRIQANRGPKCMKNTIVQNEKIDSCPPILRRNGFISHHLSCGCPFEKAEFAPFSPINTIPSFTGFPTTTKPFGESAAFPLFNMNFTNTQTKKVNEIDTSTETNSFPSTIKSSTFNFSQFNFNNLQTTPSSTMVPTKLISTLDNQPFIFENKVVTESPLLKNTSITTSTTINIPSSTFTLAAHPCASFECQNNGTCVVSSETGLASCICNIGFVGEKCEIDKCANVKCQNEGICRISKFNFEPYCECKPGTSGSSCEIVEHLEIVTQHPECEYECKNGGVCAIIANQPLCQCKPGFVGPNCNVVDLCLPESQTCSVFGDEAECRMEDQSFTTVSDTLVNGTYNCLCLNSENQWVDCLKLALTKQTEKDKDISQGIETTESNEKTIGHTKNAFNSFNVNQNKSEEEEFNLTEETDFTTDSKNSMEITHPTITEGETTSTDTSTESSTENIIISSTMFTTTIEKVNVEIIEKSTESTKSDEEKVTKAIDITPTTILIDNSNPMTTTKFIIPVNKNTSTINEENINTLSNRNNKSPNSASATTWIIVIFIILVIMMLIAGGVLFVLRYIRRSRKLHGKYNPAKEEHAIAATYALPMQAVAKEERLI